MASTLLFRALAEHFGKLEAASARLELTRLVLELLKAAPRPLVDKVVNLAQGRLYPDFVGLELGVAEKLALRALARTYGVKEEEIVAKQKKLGDLGLAAEEVAKARRQRSLTSEALHVAGVYEALEKIARTSGEGSQEQKIRLLGELLHGASPLEARYLVRIVSGKLRLGVADQTVLDALALYATKGEAKSVTELDEEERKAREDAKDVLERGTNVTSDLALVARTVFEEGLPAVKRLKIRLGVPLRPMLAERTETVQEAMDRMGGEALVEYKYDGLRVQAHLGQEIRLFSRRLEELTAQFPDVVAALEKAFKKRDLIVEGEVVAVDPKTGAVRPFQDVSQRRGRKYRLGATLDGKRGDEGDITKEVPVRFYLFDFLFEAGKDYTAEPLRDRRKRLEALLQENPHVKLSEAEVHSSAASVEDYFLQVTQAGSEGIMIKKPDSAYEAGARGFSWIKFKAEYQTGLADTFDLVVIGANWGQGRRGGWYGTLLLATYNPENGRYESVSRLATGFDDATLAGLEKKFEDQKVAKPPKDVEAGEVPDVWFQPKWVVEVVGAELTLSPRHRCAWGVLKPDAGLSVRFPRFTGKWRTDKKPTQATTSQELVRMYELQRTPRQPEKTERKAR